MINNIFNNFDYFFAKIKKIAHTFMRVW